jgi:hypothetical protein
MTAANQFFERGDREMRFAYSRWAHEEESLVGTGREIASESFGPALGQLERRGVLRCPGFSVGEVGDVAFEIAMLVALRDVSSRDDARCAFLHAAIACDSDLTGTVGAEDDSPSGAAAELAIFQGHYFFPTTEYEGVEKTASGAVDDL